MNFFFKPISQHKVDTDYLWVLFSTHVTDFNFFDDLSDSYE